MPTEDRPSRFPPFGEVLDPDAATSAERQAIRLARSMDTGTLQRKMREFAGKPEVRPSEIREMGAVSLVYARRMSAESAEPPDPLRAATALRAVTALQEGGLLITPAEKSVAYRLIKEALGG